MSGKKSIEPRDWVPQSAIIILAVIALRPGTPYDFYVALRWLACPLFAYIAWHSHRNEGNTVLVVCGALLAILYNPIFRITMAREQWVFVNIMMIFVAVWSLVETSKRLGLGR